MKNTTKALLVILALGAAGVTGVAAFGYKKYSEYAPPQLSQEERISLYQTAMEKGAAEKATWPKTENEIIGAFWEAASRYDIDRMLILCPGASEQDLRIFKDLRPSPARAIGKPEPHPTAQGVQVHPVTLDFPGYSGKTVKMAVRRLEDGRLAIDGANTIWW